MEYDRKELVDWVRGIYQNLDEADKQDALRFFPELRESEEERIRKWIISQMQRLYDEANVGGSWEDFKMTEAAIFYLNKQKESEWSPSGGEMSVLYKLCYISNQITDEDDTELTRLYQDLKREYFNGRSFENMFLIEDQKEQKPAEKQDYSGLNDLERAIHRGFLCAGVENVPVGIIKEIAKECITQMKPAEWNKEDEGLISLTIAAVEDFYDKSNPIRSKIINLLKSLRPSWKPSEKQMNCLCAVVDAAIRKHNDSVSGYEPARVLKSLYEQLKKLM